MLQVFLSALAWWDGSEVAGAGAGKEQLNYVTFGAGISEVGATALLLTVILAFGNPACKFGT